MKRAATTAIRSRKWIALAVIAAAAGPSRGADLLFDDFNGSTLDTSKWLLGTWQLGRTQLGFSPQVTGGMARLRHDTYNPSNPGGTFKGTEIYSSNNFTRGSGLEYEARVRVNAMPSGLVTSFFTYIATGGSPPLADEIDFEFLSKAINASNASYDPVLATTWNDYRTDGSNFGDPNVHSSVNINQSGLDLSQFNTVKIRWLPDRVQWYVNNVPIRTSLYAVPDLAAPIRANFWAPGTEWPDAYSNTYNPTASAAANTTQLYDIDSIAVRRIFSPVAASAPNRVFTDTFRNGNVSNSDSTNGFWSQRSQGASSVTETNATPANLAEPLKLAASGAGYPHAQIVSGVRSEFNIFRTPIAIEANGLGFSSTSNSTTVNTIGKSILRFVLASQTIASGTESEYTVPDALALRIEGGNVVALGSKVNAPNQNTEYTNNLFSQTLSGPVRRVYMVLHGTFYYLQVDYDVSGTDSTQVTSEFSGPLSLNLTDWNATGDSAMFIQGQLNNSGANENMTALVDSLAVNTVRPTWNIDGDGAWSNINNWTDKPVPNYPGANAKFTNAITTAHAVNTDIPVTAGTLTFDSTSSYTIGGASTITLDTLIDSPRIEVLSGTHTITAPVVLAKNTTIDAAAGSKISMTGTLSASAVTLTKTGAGTAEVANVRAAGLTVSAGVMRILANGGSGGTSNVGSLSVAAGATLDLKDNDLVVRATTPGSWNGSTYTGLTGLIQSGRGGGAWTGSGIVTSSASGNLTTLGVATAAQAKGIAATATTVWAGQTVTGSDTLVMYTYGGDANLDGKINVDDYTRIDFNVPLGIGGWFNGDFNYDGKINVDDYTIIDFNVGVQGAPLGSASGSAAIAVPEPSLLAAASIAMLLPRRRRATRGGVTQ